MVVPFLESEADDKCHMFVSLQDVEKKIKSEFSEVLKNISETVTEMCKTEKESWLTLDSIEEECRTLKEKVEAASNKMVNERKAVNWCC